MMIEPNRAAGLVAASCWCAHGGAPSSPGVVGIILLLQGAALLQPWDCSSWSPAFKPVRPYKWVQMGSVVLCKYSCCSALCLHQTKRGAVGVGLQGRMFVRPAASREALNGALCGCSVARVWFSCCCTLQMSEWRGGSWQSQFSRFPNCALSASLRRCSARLCVSSCFVFCF